MTLDEAIKHCEEVAERNENTAKIATPNKKNYIRQCNKCATEHRQLAEWLKDYKRMKEQEPTTKNDLGVDKFDKAINQSDLKEWIMETFPDWCEGDVRLIMNHMDEMPSVTPQERTGHWIPTYGNVECSVCGSVKDSREVGKATHYCDFCGARMESEDKE